MEIMKQNVTSIAYLNEEGDDVDDVEDDESINNEQIEEYED